MLEVVQRLEDRASLDGILGVGFKRNGKPIMNPERPLVPLVQMPPKAYHLADFDAYERLAVVAGPCIRRAWPARSIVPIARMRESTEDSGMLFPQNRSSKKPSTFPERYGLEMIWIVDDNFLVDLDRALKIAEGLVRVGFALSLEHSGDNESHGPS